MFLNKLFNYQESIHLQTPSILFKGNGKLTHLKVFNQWEQFREYVNQNYWLMYDISKILDDARYRWKKRGVLIQIPFDLFYQTYLNKKECDFCGILLTEHPFPRNNNTKVLDHCHITGKVRGVLCHKCNITKR